MDDETEENEQTTAEDALLDRLFVQVDAESFKTYSKILDQPPSGEGYERLMNAPTPWR